MRLAVLVLVTLSAGLAVAGAALVAPWTFALPAGLIAGLWITLAAWRPSSRLHVIPMLLCVGTCAFLTVGVESRILGLVGLPLALFAWDASFTRRTMSRFAKVVQPHVVLRYAAAMAGICGAAVGVAVGGNILQLRLTFPVALGASIGLLGLTIAVLWAARRSSAVVPVVLEKKEGEEGKEEGDAAAEREASPSYQPRGFSNPH
ncbi:MAG: hypothetical protein NTY63_08565 [Candidatus Bipolaricaulota bacterium]|nr:hypothetical protein [Candidatus Bipolaricaulota bacterium]